MKLFQHPDTERGCQIQSYCPVEPGCRECIDRFNNRPIWKRAKWHFKTWYSQKILSHSTSKWYTIFKFPFLDLYIKLHKKKRKISIGKGKQ